MTNMRNTVLTQLQTIVENFTPLPFPDDVNDDTTLDAFRLDSIAFTTLLVNLEGEVGFIPSNILEGIAFPETVGDLIDAYEKESV